MPVNTIVIARPVRSIEDLGAGILDAVYASDERPVPRNLDALADLLRETRANRLVVSEWRVPEEQSKRLRQVLALEGVQLRLEQLRASTEPALPKRAEIVGRNLNSSPAFRAHVESIAHFSAQFRPKFRFQREL